MSPLKEAERLVCYLLPPAPDASDKEVKHWRNFVSIIMILTIGTFAVLFGYTPFSQGIAWADDAKHPVSAIAFEEVVAKLGDIEDEQTRQGTYLKQLVKSDLRDQINRMIRLRCSLNGVRHDPTVADDEQKDLINDTIVNYQRQFKNIAGHKYDEPDCEDL